MTISKKIGLFLVLYIAGWFIYKFPLWLSPDMQERYLLYATPIGTDIKDVENWIREKKYQVDYISYDSIKDNSVNYTNYSDEEFKNKQKDNERMSIRGYGGSYSAFFILVTDVAFFWGFDKNGKLINVTVRKYVDAL